MYNLPSTLQSVANFFERLPGIGKKSANRLALYFLRLPQSDLSELAQHLSSLKKTTKMCSVCHNLTEDDKCSICQDSKRDLSVIVVVESVLDLVAFESGAIYQGLYHVLHGKIDPLNYVGPDDIFIDSLIARLRSNGPSIKEIILATNADMEGEATAMHIRSRLNQLKQELGFNFAITRLGYGMPMGGNVEYADYLTLQRALQSRSSF